MLVLARARALEQVILPASTNHAKRNIDACEVWLLRQVVHPASTSHTRHHTRTIEQVEFLSNLLQALSTSKA